MSLGERIQRVRKNENLTLKEFGEKIGIKSSSVCTMESGKSNPSKQTIKFISNAFNVREEWLRTGEGPMYKQKPKTAYELLAKACRYEFDKDQMSVIFGLLRDLPIPPDSESNDIRFGRIFWLTDLYNKFVLAAKQAEAYENPIQNRYRYFCRMIENYFTAP